MYLWNNYHFLRYLLSLILGIWICDFHLEITPYSILSTFSGLAILYFRLFVRQYSLFQNQIRNDHSRAVVVVVVIGIKDYLDQGLKSVYATLGNMHVLAV